MKSRVWTAVVVVSLLSGCNLTRQVAESSVSFYSSEHFTLIATVPANFGFTSKALYFPKSGQNCKVYSSGLGGNVTRQQQKSNAIEAKSVPQTTSTKIPMAFHIAGCSMELGRVSYQVNATYGSDAWDHGMDSAGGISVKPSTGDQSQLIKPSLVEQKGLCTWLFQISKSKAKLGEIEKILSCHKTDENWTLSKTKLEKRKPGAAIARNALAGKTVKIEFRLSNEEYPAAGDTWLKIPNGWRPCLGKGANDPYGFCRGNTQDFRTFKMNGRECTVYPGCVEPGAIND